MNERTRAVIDWMEVAREIANQDDRALPRLLSQADTSTLVAVRDSCLEVLEDLRDVQSVWNDLESKVMAALRNELATRGLVPSLLDSDEIDEYPNYGFQRQH